MTTKAASLSDYAAALVAVAAASAVCMSAAGYFDVADRAMIYLLAVLLVASRFGRWPTAFAALASVAALNFFFVPPYFTFAVHDARHLVTFAVMLLVGLVVSTLTLRIREREHRIASLYAMTRELAAIGDTAELGRVAAKHLRELFAIDATIVVSRAETMHDARVGLPLLGAHGRVGALLIDRPVDVKKLEPFIAQTALAIERALLAEEAERARLFAEREHTRNTLLAGLSHDLRTPLATIGGSASVLLDDTVTLDAGSRSDLLETIRDESERLTRLVSGLLDLARIESGAITVQKEQCPLEELLSSAIGRLGSALDGREVRTSFGDDRELMIAAVDPVLFEQVLINLLDNASKYSPAGEGIEIRASFEAEALRIDFVDHGPGFQAGEEKRVFEKFYRASDRGRVPGAGIGLALCDAIVKAHGGSICAYNAPERGAVFSVVLP